MRGSWRNWGQTRKCLVTAFNDLVRIPASQDSSFPPHVAGGRPPAPVESARKGHASPSTAMPAAGNDTCIRIESPRGSNGTGPSGRTGSADSGSKVRNQFGVNSAGFGRGSRTEIPTALFLFAATAKPPAQGAGSFGKGSVGRFGRPDQETPADRKSQDSLKLSLAKTMI